jgi:hypothetical protein
MTRIAAGTWVEIEQTVLEPAQRAHNLPEETQRVPYLLRASGFLLEDASLGEPARIRTIIGRTLAGRLRAVNPSYSHSFGQTVPELLTIGTERES